MKVDAVIVAAGSSTRFGVGNKLLARISGQSVLTRTIGAFWEADCIDRVIVVSLPAEFETTVRPAALCHPAADAARLILVPGGARRRDSVEAGLRASRARYVAIHDGARPLITPALIATVVDAAEGRPGAILGVPVTDSIKEVSDGVIVGHPERSRLWAAQTPQVVLRQAWLDAAAAGDGDETDDAAMLARFGLECAVVEGDPGNLKVTRQIDIEIAEAILRARSAE
jgi:2-C-methyl-D-erythritol 4-phosphate cytidylyltransferase